MNAITKINIVITNLLEKRKTDEFGAIESLVLLKDQISKRVHQLKTVVSFDESSTTNTSPRKETTQITPKHGVPTLENATLQLLNSTLADIETSLLKNQNIRISSIPSNIKSYKPPFINKDQINHLEHSLQLLNFNDSQDYQLRNEYLKKLNMLYYSEMMAQQETIKDIVNVVKDVESNMESNSQWKKVDQITDDSLLVILDDFQKKISLLERDKLHMENEIVFLKERYNTFIDDKKV